MPPTRRPSPRPPRGAESVLRALRSRTRLTRTQLIAESGVQGRQFNRIVSDLRAQQLIDRSGSLVDNQRPLKLHRAAGFLIGVDVTMERVSVVVSEMDFTPLNEPTRATMPIRISQPDATLATVAELVADQAAMCSVDVNKLVGVGVGLPGPIRRIAGIPGSPLFLPNWQGSVPAKTIAQHLAAAGMPNIKVVVGNDSSLGALGAYTRCRILDPIGAPDDLIYVRVETGVGAGLVTKGHLTMGTDGFAGEIGHIRTEPDGPVCPRCRRRGCLEMFASGSSILERIRDRARADGTPVPRNLSEALRDPDQVVVDAVGVGGWHLGFVLAAVANFLNPALLVLGGEVAETPWFLLSARKTMTDFAMDPCVENLRMTTWNSMPDEIGGTERRVDGDPGTTLSAELLGALAFVVDELGDEYLVKAHGSRDS